MRWGRRSRHREDRLEWLSDSEFRIADTQYACRSVSRPFKSTSDRFCLRKEWWGVQRYQDLVGRLAPEGILEVGTFDGASAALLYQLAGPRKLVTVDIDGTRRDALDDFIGKHGLERTVVPHYGIDQADCAALAPIVESEFAGIPLDLVIDDASHVLGLSRATFNCLFPRLRPGGIYVLEDWSWSHAPIPVRPEDTPLTVLVFELVMACAHHHRVVRDVVVNHGWALVTRGDEELDPLSFNVSKLYDERARRLVTGL